MARMFPSKLPTNRPKSEKMIFRRLESLPKEFLVFFSVLWQSKRGGRQGDGEADFVVLHPQFGILIVEVKGGCIDIECGEWYSTGENGRFKIKNPFQQAIDSKFALIEYLKGISLGNIPVGHCVAFPDEPGKNAIGTYGPREIIWYKNDLIEINKVTSKTYEHWGSKCSLDQGVVGKVVTLLAPTTSIKRTFLKAIEDANDDLLELTERQVATFKQLRRNRKVVVLGGAGTGKTVLAMERARQLNSEGFNTLFVCYNELIGKHVERQLHGFDNILATRYHALCVREARRAGIRMPANPDSDWWENRAPDLLVEAAGKNGTTFDAIVVDEGQDFSQEWMDSLALLCTNTIDPPFYVFMDNRQDIYRRKWTPGNEFFHFDLDVNCRNTLPIARRVSSLFFEEPLSLGCSGPEPVFVDLESETSLIEIVQIIVERMILEELLEPERIVVLSNDHQFISKIKLNYVGDVPFTEFGKVGIISETIKRFKGLECDVLVLVISDDIEDNKIEEFYVGMSRAKSGLFVMGSKATREQMNWPK